MRLIDADALMWKLQSRLPQVKTIPTWILDAVLDEPTIDAYGEGYKQGRFDAEADMDYLVRCKDCRHWSEMQNSAGACLRHSVMDGSWWTGTDATDFCSFAERREND